MVVVNGPWAVYKSHPIAINEHNKVKEKCFKMIVVLHIAVNRVGGLVANVLS